MGTYDGDLVAKLIFLMFLAFTDTLYFRFMQGVDLMGRITSLAEDPFIESEQTAISVIPFQVPFKLTHQPARYRSELPVCLECLGVVLGMITKTLVPVDPLQNEPIALAQGKIQLFYNRKYMTDYLFMQLGIGGKSYVLFLDGGINEGSIMMILVIIITVDSKSGRGCARVLTQPHCFPTL